MEIYKAELKKIIVNPLFYTTMLIMLILSMVILAAEKTVYSQPEEALYRSMCEKHQGAVNSDYLVYMEAEADKYDKKLAEYNNIEIDYSYGLINEIEYAGLMAQRDKIIKEKQIFDMVYNRALKLDRLLAQANEYLQSSNPAKIDKGESLINAKTPEIFYDTGWIRFFSVGYFELVLLLGIGVILGNIYASEYELGTWAIIFPTLKGRSRLSKIKILAGSTVVLLMAVCFLIVKYAAFKLIYDLDGINSSVISILPSLYSSLSIKGFLILGSSLQLVGCIVFCIFIMWMSLFCKNVVGAYVSGLGALLITFWLGMQSGKIHIFSLWWNLISSERVLGGKHVIVFEYAVGSKWIYILTGSFLSIMCVFYCIKYFGHDRKISSLERKHSI